MKTSRFTDSQIIAILKQAEAGTPARTLRRIRRSGHAKVNGIAQANQ